MTLDELIALPDVSDGYTFTGFTNPALAAIEVVEYLFPHNDINQDSFEEVARRIGDSPESVTREGFFVHDMDSLNRLCEIGGFYIKIIRGEVTCLLTEEERLALPGVEKPVQQPDDWRIRRLAYVQEWSDAVIDCALRHLKDSPDALGVMQKAADDINLCALRGHDEALLESGAKALGFSSADEFTHFKRENPFLSACLKAEPAQEGSSGFVVGVSSTEVVFAADNGAVMAFERAWLSTDIAVGDVVKVDRFRVAERTALALETPYKAGQTYNGIIPEIKYLPVTAIERQERDFRPEVMEVSDEVAANMDSPSRST